MKFLTQSNDTIWIDCNLNNGLKNVHINKEIDSQWIIKRFELDISDDILEKLSKDTKAPEKLRFIKKAEMFFVAKYKTPILNENGEIISGDSIWNQWLFDKISSEIFQWIKELVKSNKFCFQAYRLIPSKLNPENNILTKRFNDSFE
ncbi:unnamed protein product, partial [Rotaria sordida]